MARAACWAWAPLGFWYSGRSQRTRPDASSFARSAFSATTPFEDFSVRQRRRPAVGGEHGGVEVIVQLPQHRHQARVVNLLLFRVQGFAGAELLQDVIHARQRQARMLRLHSLAVRVQLFGDLANAVLCRCIAGWERERVEAAGVVVSRIVSDTEVAPRRQRVNDMNAAAQNTEMESVVQGE